MKRLFAVSLTALMLSGCAAADIDNEVKLPAEDYPKVLGTDYDAIEVATFVHRRTKLAKQLFGVDGHLNDSITVLEDLVRYVPTANRNRYDLGIMYYQRATPKFRDYRNAARRVTELRAASKIPEAEDAEIAMAKSYELLRPDVEKALKQFLIYAQKMPQDPRSADMMWRCYMALERYEEALAILTRVLDWEGVIKDEQRNGYVALQKFLRSHILQERRIQGVDLPPELRKHP